MFSFLINTGTCQNGLWPSADARDWGWCTGRHLSFYFPVLLIHARNAFTLGFFILFPRDQLLLLLAKSSDPLLGQFLHISKPQVLPPVHFPMVQRVEVWGWGGDGEVCVPLCIIQFMYIIHEASMNLLPIARMQEMVQHLKLALNSPSPRG